MTERDDAYLVCEEFGGHYNADLFYDFDPESLPEAALDSAGRLSGRADDEDVPIADVVALLAAVRDDRAHPLLDELGKQTLYGWRSATEFPFLQELFDAISLFLEEEPSADVTLLRYAHGDARSPITPGRTVLLVDSRGHVRLTHTLWPHRSVHEAKLLPGVWEEITGALARAGFPERAPAGVLTAEMTKLTFTRIVGDRVESILVEPREPYLDAWRVLLAIIGQMRGSRDFERRVGDVKVLR